MTKSDLYMSNISLPYGRISDMGILQRKFSGTVDPNLICSVCREVFDNPVRTKTCGHVFCQDCVGEWICFGNDNCPECRKALSQSDISVDRLIASLIGNLTVNCPNGREHQEKKQLEDRIFRQTLLRASSSSSSTSNDNNNNNNNNNNNGSTDGGNKKSMKQQQTRKQKLLDQQYNKQRPNKRRKRSVPGSRKNTSKNASSTTTTITTTTTTTSTSEDEDGDANTKSKKSSSSLKKKSIEENDDDEEDNGDNSKNDNKDDTKEEELYCTWTGKYSELENHVRTCKHEKVSCTHNEFGCAFIGKRFELETHLKCQCVFDKVKEILYSQKKELKETKDKLEETNSQKTHLETVLAAHTGSWLKEIQIGTKLDAKDKFGRWYEGTIIAMHGNDQVRVHFDGWNSNFDELMVKSPERLAPLHLHSIKRKNKRKAQRKFRDFEDGDIIDCKDTMGDWYESVVLDVKDDQVLIHYEGWPNVWDEWIDKSSSRLAPYRTHSLRVGAAHARFLYSQQQQQLQQQNLMRQNHHQNFVNRSRSWF